MQADPTNMRALQPCAILRNPLLLPHATPFWRPQPAVAGPSCWEGEQHCALLHTKRRGGTVLAPGALLSMEA